MSRLSILAASILLATPSFAQDWRQAAEYDVLLTSYDIQPGTMRLEAGKPVRLRFVNNSNQGHSFSARGFFRKARLRDSDGAMVADGSLEVEALSTRTLVLVPKAGRYKVRSSNRLHRLLGMTGTIVVE